MLATLGMAYPPRVPSSFDIRLHRMMGMAQGLQVGPIIIATHALGCDMIHIGRWLTTYDTLRVVT
jgi:hypothetical protein